eukprot:6180162-Pleurochrysis_carterae.AAC.1
MVAVSDGQSPPASEAASKMDAEQAAAMATARTHSRYAQGARKNGDHQLAVEQFSRAISWAAVAVVAEHKKTAGAHLRCSTAVDLSVRSLLQTDSPSILLAAVYLHRAETRLVLEQHELASHDATLAASFGGEGWMPLLCRARAMAALGALPEATADARRVLNMQPGSSGIKTAMQLLRSLNAENCLRCPPVSAEQFAEFAAHDGTRLVHSRQGLHLHFAFPLPTS